MSFFAKRIIPCLDVDNGRVVKGVNFLGLRDAGDPVEVAKRYNIEGADEITFLDIGASHEGRDTIVDVVKKVAKETLDKLKEEKLKIDRWRESREITAQIRIMIRDNLYHLPEDAYSEVDVELKSINVYQHIYTNYFGGGKSVYQQSA